MTTDRLRRDDVPFLRRLFPALGYGVAGPSSREVLSRCSICVRAGGGTLDAIRITVFDGSAPLLAFGFHWLRGATVVFARDRALYAFNDREQTDDRLHTGVSRRSYNLPVSSMTIRRRRMIPPRLPPTAGPPK